MEIHSLTRKHFADSILNGLMSCGIDCEFLYGQGYDGASNMLDQFQGVQAHIRVKYPKAIYVHCVANSLNLAVSTASNIKAIRNCLVTRRLLRNQVLVRLLLPVLQIRQILHLDFSCSL